MATRKSNRTGLDRQQVTSILEMYRALGVLRRTIHLLPEEAQGSMRQVIRAVKQNQVEKRLGVIDQVRSLGRKEVAS